MMINDTILIYLYSKKGGQLIIDVREKFKNLSHLESRLSLLTNDGLITLEKNFTDKKGTSYSPGRYQLTYKGELYCEDILLEMKKERNKTIKYWITTAIAVIALLHTLFGDMISRLFL